MTNDQLILEKLGQLEQRFATVDSCLNKLENTINRIAADVAGLQVDMSEVKATLRSQSEKLDDLQINQDWLVGKFKKLDQEQVFGSANLDRVRKDVDSLKVRIERLELASSRA